MNWILPAITAALGIVLILAVVLCILASRMQKKRLANISKQRDELNRENESLHTANKRIVTEQLELHKQNTKLREDLTETQAENALWLRAISTLPIEDIENLLLGQLTPMLRERIVRTREHQTVEIEEVKPEPKRTPRKKAVN